MKTNQRNSYYLLRFFFLANIFVSSDAGPHEKRLLAHLFNRSRPDAHNPMERPASIDGSPVRVYLKCFLNQIMDVDEKNQILSTIIWLDLKWKDYHFHWDANEYGGVQTINISPDRMWKPDIILYNSASEKFDQMFPVKVVVQHDGNIQWIPPGLFHSICTIEVDWFPFDAQYCHLKLGTWTYQGDTVDLKLQCENDSMVDKPCNLKTDVDLSTYLAHSEWALESAIVKRQVQKYGSEENQTYIDLTMYAHIQRRALYYMFNIIMPCMIMSVMAMLVFTLPPDANEKIVLGVTTLLSLTMLLQLVADKLPQTSSGNPVLVVYFTCTIVLCSMSLVFAIGLLNCHHHSAGSDDVPWVIKTLVNNWLASILRIEVTADRECQLDQPDERSDKVDRSKRHGNSIGGMKSTPDWSNMLSMEMEFRPTLVTNRWSEENSRHGAKRKLTTGDQLIMDKSMIQLPGGKENRLFTISSPGNHVSPGLQYSCTEGSIQPDSPGFDHQPSSKPKVTSKKLPPEESFSESLSDQGKVEDFSEKAYIIKRVRELASEIRCITDRMHRTDKLSRSTSQWKLASRVLDRLCLLIFAAINLFITLGVLTSAPTIIKAFTARGEPSKAM